MNEKGKNKQILFEHGLQRNNFTGEIEQSPNSFFLWTDKGLENLIKSIEGVMFVRGCVDNLETRYSLLIDPRYDIEFVKAEIEAKIILELGEI